MKEKQCSACDEVKPVSEFRSDRSKKTGYSSNCKDCKTIGWLTGLLCMSDEQREQLRMRKKKYAVEYRRQNEGCGVEYRSQHKERYLEHQRRWQATNRGLTRNYTRTRKKQLDQRTFPEQREAINAFYQNCPPGYHVDHIVPITHPLVSGLHVLANLQYLTANENSRKRNRFTIE
ncbi:HNH endonuclease [bacterium]|nr:HNH endonuclease [bacterium]